MKKLFSLAALLLLLASCTSELDQMINGSRSDKARQITVFQASVEGCSMPETKVYADKNMKVLWNADDRISIFNMRTLNDQYAFTGDDGDTAGGFEEIPASGFVTGQEMSYVYAAYPYSKSNKLDNDGVFTMVLPSEQSYKEQSFGIGANTMVAITDGSFLAFKNVGGYLSLRLYGDDIKVRCVSIHGNNGEKIAGKATIDLPFGGTPTVTMDDTATETVSILCNPAVTIGGDANNYTDFWFVIPPVTFTKGFTITVTDDKGGVFEKSTTNSFTVSRNTLDWMKPLEVVPNHDIFNIEFADPEVKNICVANWDTNRDGELSNEEAANVTDLGSDFQYSDIISFNELQYFTGIMELKNAFQECFFLEEITLPYGLTIIGDSAFEGCNALKRIAIPTGVTYIGYQAFRGCSKLEELTIPTGLTTIFTGAFAECRSLSEILLPSTVTRINSDAFSGCTSLTEITIPASVTTIANSVFAECSSLTSVVIPESVTTIGSCAFENCSSLSEISIPAGVTSIEGLAFHGCSNLTTVNLPTSAKITNLAPSSFAGCSALQTITIPYRVKSIGWAAFANCTNLTTVIIPSNSRLTSIEQYAFSGCSNLTSIDLPEGVTILGNSSFAECMNLTTISLPEGLTTLGEGTFSGCSSLTEITIPSGVTSIGGSAFSGCSSLTSISFSLDAQLADIGNYSFRDCLCLTSVSLPLGVSSIGYGSFWGCNSLESVIIFATTPPSLDNSGFYAILNPYGGYDINYDEYVPIYVPDGSVMSYKSAAVWSNFASRIYPLSTLL